MEITSKRQTFPNMRTFSMELAGRTLTVETGKMSGLSNGSCFVRYGDTAILCNVTMAEKPREGIDFFPLSVDFEEKIYAVGRIPGSFMRREGRPGEKAVLTSRVIDRQIRPLFPKDMRNDVAVVMTVMSVDQDCSPEVVGMIGTSLALSISDIPWNGPTAGVMAGLVDGEIVINPTLPQREASDLALTLAASAEKVVMIEAGANEVDEATMLEAIKKCHAADKEVIAFINSIVAEIGKKKVEFPSMELDHDLFEHVRAEYLEKFRAAMDTDDKNVRDARLLPIEQELTAQYGEQHGGVVIGELMYKMQKTVVRRWLLDDGKRVDGRGIDEIRPLAAEVGLLGRVHGSGMFTRGQTQCLTAATLSTMRDAQIIDDISPETNKRYMHHYNFPPYSTGETGRMGAPKRREIGHGFLAERALYPVLPSEVDFPYSVRIVSEVTESNGSSSMASACGSTLSLMDAGVPITRPVSGIAMGLIKEDDRVAVLTDIQGIEDFLGDMDFKVCGTEKGITALQMDNKAKGLTVEILAQALSQAKEGRAFILGKMLEAIDQPRGELSEFAPRIISIQIPVDKIRDVIGSGGKVIRALQEETGATIEISEDGTVYIASKDTGGEEAKRRIEQIIKVPEIGEEYLGQVVSIQSFGAFVELLPGKDGLLHISRVAEGRVGKVEDVLSVGDEVRVKIIDIDDKDKISLDRLDKPVVENSGSGAEGRYNRDDRGGRGDRSNRGDGDRKPRKRR